VSYALPQPPDLRGEGSIVKIPGAWRIERAVDQARLGWRSKTEYIPKDWSDKVSSWCNGFTGKRIIEVGCDTNGRFINQIARLYRPLEIVGLNPVIQSHKFSATCRLEKGDIRSTAFEDGYFDVIVSSAAFEHIQNFDVALAEMYRILKPGGYLFSHFGPIWSASYGHHLWLTYNDRLYNYWNVILPPYCHLLSDAQQIVRMIAGMYPLDVCEAIAEYACNSTDQNHLFFEDYESFVANSPFKILVFKGSDAPELSDKYNRQMTPDTFRLLQEKYPGRKYFCYEGITLLLQKPAVR